MPAGPRGPSGMALGTSSGLPAGRGRAWRRCARGGLGRWGALGRPHSYFDLLSLLSVPADAFRSRAVKWEAWGAGLCSPCPPDCLLCCSVWGVRCLCSCSCKVGLLYNLLNTLRLIVSTQFITNFIQLQIDLPCSMFILC